MKYSSGDKVRIRTDLEIGKYGDIYFTDRMICLRGNEVTISRSMATMDGYYVSENSCVFSDEMLEDIIKQLNYEIF